MKSLLIRIGLCFLALVVPPAAEGRTIEFETTEVTEADVTVSPDGQWLIFTMLGHLFRLPVEGGTAEQLTFGPYYDTDPVFSPDGTRVAFVSDRDGSEGNVFVLKLVTGEITQVTHEPWAGRPIWTPDGQVKQACLKVRSPLLSKHLIGSLAVLGRILQPTIWQVLRPGRSPLGRGIPPAPPILDVHVNQA